LDLHHEDQASNVNGAVKLKLADSRKFCSSLVRFVNPDCPSVVRYNHDCISENRTSVGKLVCVGMPLNMISVADFHLA
jgi:hypothetical protein